MTDASVLWAASQEETEHLIEENQNMTVHYTMCNFGNSCHMIPQSLNYHNTIPHISRKKLKYKDKDVAFRGIHYCLCKPLLKILTLRY